MVDLIRLDQKLHEIHELLDYSRYIDPTNDREERKAFLKSGRMPVYTYPELGFDARSLERRLRFTWGDESLIGTLLEEKRLKLLLWVEYFRARGSSESINLSRQLFGIPSLQTIEWAMKLITLRKGRMGEKRFSSEHVLKGLERHVGHAYGWEGWNFEIVEGLGSRAYIYPPTRDVKVKKGEEFAERDSLKLKRHEIDVHALRTENGALQKYLIFSDGTSEYERTDEGLAKVVENASGLITNRTLRTIAAYTLAVDMLVKGENFSNIFEMLRQYGFKEKTAYNLTRRVFRGGGFTKDHIYLSGWEDVAKYGGNLNLLFTGKIAISDMEQVEQLLKQGILVPPKYLPKL